jgi:hypothetical protein
MVIDMNDALLRTIEQTEGFNRANALVWRANRLARIPLKKRYGAPAAPFARKHTGADLRVLVQMDRAQEDVCGPAISHLFKRAFALYGDTRYERLAGLSVSHLYNLRKQTKPRLQPRVTSHTTTRAVYCNR